MRCSSPVSVFDFPDGDTCMNCYRVLDYHEQLGLCYDCEMILQPPSSWYIHFLGYDGILGYDDGYLTQDEETYESLEDIHNDLWLYDDIPSPENSQ